MLFSFLYSSRFHLPSSEFLFIIYGGTHFRLRFSIFFFFFFSILTLYALDILFLFLHTGGVDRLADGKGFLQLKATPHIIPLMACGAQRADDFDGRQSLTLYSVLNRLSLLTVSAAVQ